MITKENDKAKNDLDQIKKQLEEEFETRSALNAAKLKVERELDECKAKVANIQFFNYLGLYFKKKLF